jgi:hypothetical protein
VEFVLMLLIVMSSLILLRLIFAKRKLKSLIYLPNHGSYGCRSFFDLPRTEVWPPRPEPSRPKVEDPLSEYGSGWLGFDLLKPICPVPFPLELDPPEPTWPAPSSLELDPSRCEGGSMTSLPPSHW